MPRATADAGFPRRLTRGTILDAFDDLPALPLPCAAGDAEGQRFARAMGAEWAGGSDESPPEPLDAVVRVARVGAFVRATRGA